MIPEPITPDDKLRRLIEEKSAASSNMCWTCGTCDIECPVYLSTARLDPQKIIRMANLGMLTALTELPEIWYCLSCRRCHRGCPNAVKPYEVIHHARREALIRRLVPHHMWPQLQQLLSRFQRVRWRTVEACMHGELNELSAEKWQQWLEEPIKIDPEPVRAGRSAATGHPAESVSDADSHACYTCSECSGCCPIFSSRPVFDPQYIIRMANLGLTDEVIHSPSIWLCLKCELCGSACSQKVRGYKVIQDLQTLALEEEIVDAGFPERLDRAERVIYPLLIEAVDGLRLEGDAD